MTPENSLSFPLRDSTVPTARGKRLSASALLLVLCGIAPLALSSPSSVAETITGAQLTPGPIPFPANFMTSVKTYGAVGDGVHDDTKAIQSALSDGRGNPSADYNGLPKALYFPPGVYLVSNTLSWNGCCVTLQGDGSSASVIKLASSAPGFNNANSPRSVIKTAATNRNESFRQNIWDLGITVGSNNPGATALTYSSNNIGSIHNVSILSQDGKGVIGLDLTQRYPGPMMVKNVSITGFQRGIDTCDCYEYSATMEGVTLNNQSVAGIYDWRETLNIRNLKSNNRVPALVNDGASAVLIDAALTGGASSNPAISNNATLYVRNISSSGYAFTLTDASPATARVVRGAISELTSKPVSHLLSNPASGSLKLPVEETPTASITNSSDFVAFIPRWYGDTAGLQSTFDSGKHNVYFPSGRYFAYNQASVIVPDAVQSVIGFGSVVNGSSGGKSGGGYQLVVDSDSPTPLVIEQFGYGIQVIHHGARPVVLKDGGYRYTSSPGAGNLFIEDVGLPQFTIESSQKVWARQLDDEFSGTKIVNNGTFWIMGLKTERAGTVIASGSGAKTELLGALIYPATSVPSSNIAFTSNNASTSYIYTESVYCGSCGYATQIQQRQSGASQSIKSNPAKPFIMPLFVGK